MDRLFETDPDKVDWNRLRSDVVERIELLETSWRGTFGQPFHETLVRDLYGPLIKLLGEFVACVECVELQNEAADAQD